MKNLFSISRPASFLLVIFALLVVSCQKEGDLQPEMNATSETQVEIPPLAFEKLIVETVFSLPVEELSDEEVLAHYEEFMQGLSEEDRLIYETEVKRAFSEGYTSATGALNFRASETVLSPEDGGLTYGWSVATVGNKVYVGSRGASQKVYEYAKTGGNYNLISEIVPGEEAVDFGTYLSVSGSWMAVAAPDFFGDQGGKVFMFKKQGNAWVKQAVLTSSVPGRGFGGRGVVLKGNTLAVGGSSLGGFPSPEGSPISVFELNENNWTLSETIRRPGNDFFEIDMDNGGNRIVGTGALNGSGAFIWASIFVREGSGWAFEDQVVAPFGSGFLARDVAIHNNTVVITAVVPGNKYFVCTNKGGDWEITQELIGTSLPPQNRFVDMSEEKIVVGAASFDNSISDEVQIFEKSGGTWSLTEVLTMGDNGADKRIWSVAISGNTIVAGLPGSSFPPVPPGSASVFD